MQQSRLTADTIVECMFLLHKLQSSITPFVGWRQDSGNRSIQESKFDFLATRQRLVKIYDGQQKIKIACTN